MFVVSVNNAEVLTILEACPVSLRGPYPPFITLDATCAKFDVSYRYLLNISKRPLSSKIKELAYNSLRSLVFLQRPYPSSRGHLIELCDRQQHWPVVPPLIYRGRCGVSRRFLVELCDR